MAWWILGGLCLLFLLVCLTRLGILVAFHEGTAVADLRIGPFKFRVVPTKPHEKKKKETESQKKAPKEKTKNIKKPPKFTLDDAKAAISALTPACKKALRRTRRGVRIHPLSLSVTIGGGEDAAAAAQLYGYAQAFLWTVMPLLEELLVIPDPRIHIGLDFETGQLRWEVDAGISVRIGTLIALGFGMGIPALKWFISYQKRQPKPPAAEPAEHAAA